MEKSNNDLFELITKMYSDLKSEISDVKKDISGIKAEQIKTNERLDSLSEGVGKMVAHEVADELSTQLKEIKTDVRFVKRKVQDTEEDVFVIQDHLKIIK
ncbi:hypothetical protein [Clostridium sp. BJN0001]|uniref:hypothetical protein n=1 Tax=Clostridium sp. BJN0001 TaxID=2930219 RepID=UPI001FD4A73C|nr:hypothetical protein [Clostridium sp. BJN0001]